MIAFEVLLPLYHQHLPDPTLRSRELQSAKGELEKMHAPSLELEAEVQVSEDFRRSVWALLKWFYQMKI